MILPFGERALLAELSSLGEVVALADRLRSRALPGVTEILPAARTILVRIDPAVTAIATVQAWLRATDAASAPPARRHAPLVEVPIVYDGLDLEATASEMGMSAEALAARHHAAEWTVAFTGFAPGFGYLVSEGWGLDVPRLASPRTRVPAGSVGLAGEFSGAYPRETPGGWRLIGTTSAQLFDPAAAEPALLRPGARVRFAPAREAIARPAAAPQPAAAPRLEAIARTEAAPRPAASPHGAGGRPAFTVLAAGALTTVQDQGRAGRLADGVAFSGAADRAALRTGNRLVGNAEGAAGLEITLGGFRAVAADDLWIAVTGGWGPLRVGDLEVDPFRAVRWPAGATLEVGPLAHGARAFLAVRGGVAGPAVLGSRATDVLAGLGPRPLASGDTVALSGEEAAAIPVDDLHPWGPPPDVLEIPLAPGPRRDWFTREANELLFEALWTVSADADRIGIRLDGPALTRSRTGELPSEGMLPGALQVPPRGRPVILGPDGPVTGGYPVIAVVPDASRDLLGGARPGTRLRMRHARVPGRFL